MGDTASTSASELQAARMEFRAVSRLLLRRPTDTALHVERLGSALRLPGAEPVQGALADALHGCAAQLAPARRQRLIDGVAHRLPPATVRRFAAQAVAAPLPRCTPLATRWSVLCSASLDQPRRARRCGPDESQRRADDALRAWRSGDQAALDDFLEHCRVCRDTLAFMRVRRQVLRELPVLPRRWADLCTLLQAAGVAA